MQALVFVLLFLFANSFLVACSSLSTSNKEQAEVYLQAGTQQLQSGKFPQAMSSLLQAEKLNPSNPLIQNNLGLAYFVREHYAEAEKHFAKAIEIKPDYTDAKNNLGRTQIELNKFQEALEILAQAEQDLTYTSPEKPLLNIGYVHFRMGRYELAKGFFLRALAIQRDNCFAYNYYGRSLYELKQYSLASEALDRAAGFCQPLQFDEPHYYGALAYYQDGKRSKAESRLEQLLKIYPQGKYKEQAKAMLETMKR